MEQLRSNLDQAMIRGATSPNTGISQAAIRGARYLKNGGRVVIVFSLATTAYVLLTASNDELERLLHQEVGGFIGGSIGTGAAVGACLVFGIATGGWARYFEQLGSTRGWGSLASPAQLKGAMGTSSNPKPQSEQPGQLRQRAFRSSRVMQRRVRR